MRKYLYIFKTTIIESLQYVSSVLIQFLSFFIMMYVFINLWQYVYSDSNQIINGYTVNQMIWYVLFGEVFWFGIRNKTLTNQISTDIKTGNIAYNINKPYNYVFYIITKHLGEITIKFFTFIILGVAIGEIFIGNIPNFNIQNVPFIAISVILGILINSIIRITISVISFWIEDSKPIHWIYDKSILILGTLFPIDMFPQFMQPILKYTPVYVVNYGPIKLILNFSMENFGKVLIAQIIYLIIIMVVLMIIYKKGEKKLNINGG